MYNCFQYKPNAVQNVKGFEANGVLDPRISMLFSPALKGDFDDYFCRDQKHRNHDLTHNRNIRKSLVPVL